MAQRNPSKITESLEVDDPLVQDADFEFDADDRQYIDNQIRGVQEHLVAALIRGRLATYYRLDGGSAAVVAGDTVCMASSSGAAEPTVTKSTSTALGNAKAAGGVVLLAAAPGSRVLVAMGGQLPPTITGLAASSPGPVRVDTTTGRCERVASLSASDYPIGTVDSAGWLQVGPVPTGVAGAASDATSGTKGVIQLAGDLAGTGGTAAAPRVSGLTGVSGVVTNAATSITGSGNARMKPHSDVANVQTTDDTETSLFEWTIPDEAVSLVTAEILAVKSDGSATAAYVVRARIKRNGGTVTVGTPEVTLEDEDSLAGTVTIDNSDSTGRIRVTGIAATTIDWGAIVTRLEMTHA